MSAATTYTIVGYPQAPDASETYTAVAVLDGQASAAGTITLPATTGISWNGGSVGAAGSVGILINGTSQTFTVKFAPGSYQTIPLTHTGLGFTVGDPTLPSAIAYSGGGTYPDVADIVAGILAATLPLSASVGTFAEALIAARAQAFGRWAIVGMNLNLYGADGQTVIRTFVLDNPDNARART